jgi:hypothetical protein
MVRELHDQGKTNIEVAQTMAARFPEDWGAKTAHRTVARILKEFDAETSVLAMSKDAYRQRRDSEWRFALLARTIKMYS